jgi:hypothetical protein
VKGWRGTVYRTNRVIEGRCWSAEHFHQGCAVAKRDLTYARHAVPRETVSLAMP